MKVEIREKADEVKYPCLMIHKEMGFIVLFKDKQNGMVVSSNSEHFNIGDHSEYWDSTLFRQFNGEITLKND